MVSIKMHPYLHNHCDMDGHCYNYTETNKKRRECMVLFL